MTILNLNEPRKIISLKYSFIVCLPHQWLKYHNLGKGDLIEFQVNEGGFLIIKPVETKNAGRPK